MLLKVASLQDAGFHTSSDHDKDHRTDGFEASPDILTGVWFTDKPHMYLNGIIKKQSKCGEQIIRTLEGAVPHPAKRTV
jgi:hypothetical protein